MAQIHTLDGIIPKQTIPELRVDVVYDQTANVKIFEVDHSSNTVNLYNVGTIISPSGRRINANSIVTIT